MRYYDVVGRRDTNGTWLLTIPAFPEAASFGSIRAKAFKNAAKALQTTIAARIKDNEPLPIPLSGSPTDNFLEVPPLLYLKGALYIGMREKGISRERLAQMMYAPEDRVDRLLAVDRNSELGLLQAALRHVGIGMEVKVIGGTF